MPVDEAIAHLLASQENDAAMQISAPALKAALDSPNPPRLLDVRSREEFDAVRLPGAELMTQPLDYIDMSRSQRFTQSARLSATNFQSMPKMVALVGAPAGTGVSLLVGSE